MTASGKDKTDHGHPWLEWLSLPLLIVLWQGASWLAQSRFAPGPGAVWDKAVDLAIHGHLVTDFGQTLARAAISFCIALIIGGLVGWILGRVSWLDHLFSSWVVVGLNVPAIVVAIVCYIWLGLTDTALILAVVLNKIPLVATTIREGVRDMNADYEELAQVYRMPGWRRFRLIVLPQLLPYILTAARAGLSLVWKIVLVFEVLGSDGGVGFRVGIFFQYFDMAGILAYTVCFVAIILGLEYGLLRPVERRILGWRLDRT